MRNDQMTIAQQIGQVARQQDINAKATDFARLAQFVMAHGGFSKAAYAAQTSSRNGNLGPKLAGIIQAGVGGISGTQVKAAVTAMNLGGTAFQDVGLVLAGFAQATANISAFQTLLTGGAMVVPMAGTVGAVTVGASGYVVSEGSVKPISNMSLTGSQLTATKAHAVATFTSELVRSTSGAATALISRTLQQTAAVAVDTKFIATLVAGLSAATSAGSTAESVRFDIAAMLRSITTGVASKLFLITTAAICKSWSMLTDSKGVSAFPNLTPLGGEINGIRVLVSDGCTAGQVVLVDASKVAIGATDFELQEYRDGNLQFDSSPDSPPSASTNFVSLWQMNEIAIAVERWFVAVRTSTDCVAVVSNSGSYASGNSPP
jgi:hypothetical protein